MRGRQPEACETDGDEVAPRSEVGRTLSEFAAPSFGDASDPLLFDSQDLDYVPWRPTKWSRLCAEAQKPEMTFADLGRILIDLVDLLPTAFRKYLVQLIAVG